VSVDAATPGGTVLRAKDGHIKDLVPEDGREIKLRDGISIRSIENPKAV